jgi:hypothetical protein
LSTEGSATRPAQFVWRYGVCDCVAKDVPFEKVWQSYENLCTESMLGAAKSEAMADGRIIVRFREHSRNFDPEKEQAPAILSVEITYKWDGTSYINAGRKEQPESRVTAR